jgi:predicted amidohydrolase YtcJ
MAILPLLAALAAAASEPADLIIRRAKVLTVDDRFTVAEAVAVRAGRITAVGSDAQVMRLAGPETEVIDAGDRTVMPGLYDSHMHPTGAAVSELSAPLPKIRTLADVTAHLRAQAAATPKGEWIVMRYVFPTRLAEARFPTRAELDAAAPDHPVLFHAGPAGMVNTAALRRSGIAKDTPGLPEGVVRDPATGEPTGMIRNAYGALKGVPAAGGEVSAEARREAVAKLFALYNRHGITSVADRNAGRDALDLYCALRDSGKLTVRVNVARSFNPAGTREQIAKRLDDLVGPDKAGGPTGVGDDWVRVGPIKLFLDGGMLNGTAYMREPWPKGPTYQVITDDYRGMLFIPPGQLDLVLAEAAGRGWRMTAHTAGEGAMDELLDAYERLDRAMPIRDRRFCITHANFPSARNLLRCKALGVCADVQPAWLWKDGATLLNVLGPARMRWFQPYRSWMEHTVVGGGSDHMLGLDPVESINPWSPWLGIWVAVTRRLERGGVHNPDERITREQAIRLYTRNNAWLNGEENDKGTLEIGKLADLILLDRDVLACPEDDLRGTQVLRTIVGGRTVYRRE